jgi:hypothetical protein
MRFYFVFRAADKATAAAAQQTQPEGNVIFNSAILFC